MSANTAEREPSLAHEVDALTINLLRLLSSATKEEDHRERGAQMSDPSSPRGPASPTSPVMADVMRNLQRLAQSERGLAQQLGGYHHHSNSNNNNNSTTLMLSSATPTATPVKYVESSTPPVADRREEEEKGKLQRPRYAREYHRKPPLSSSSSSSVTAAAEGRYQTKRTADESTLLLTSVTDTDDASAGGGGGSPRSPAIGRWHAKQLIDELRRVEERTAAQLDQQAIQFEQETEQMRAQLAHQQQQIFALQQDKFDLQEQLFAAGEKRAVTADALRSASAQLSELEEAQQDELVSWRRQCQDLRAQLARTRLLKERAEGDLQTLSSQFAVVSGELARSKARVSVLRQHSNLVAVRSKQKDEELHDVAVFVKKALLPFVAESDKLHKRRDHQ